MASPKPFPWSALQRFTPAEVRALSLVRRWRPSDLSATDVAMACEPLIGQRLGLAVSSATVTEKLPAFSGFVRVPIALGGEEQLQAALYLQNTLAARLVRWAAKHEASKGTEQTDATTRLIELTAKVNDATPVGRELAQAVGALVALVAARTGEPWRLAPPPPDEGTFTVVEVRVSAAGAAYAALVAVRTPPLTQPPPDPLTYGALAALGDLPISLPVVASVCGATDDDFASLEPGAAWAPGEATWSLRQDESGAWQGDALLVAPAYERAIGVRVDKGRGLCVTAVQVPCPWDSTFYDDSDEGRAIHVVRVEVGRVTLGARAWAAALTSGAPLPMPRGRAVTLRAGGVAIARGRLARAAGELVVRVEETIHGLAGPGEGTTP